MENNFCTEIKIENQITYKLTLPVEWESKKSLEISSILSDSLEKNGFIVTEIKCVKGSIIVTLLLKAGEKLVQLIVENLFNYTKNQYSKKENKQLRIDDGNIETITTDLKFIDSNFDVEASGEGSKLLSPGLKSIKKHGGGKLEISIPVTINPRSKFYHEVLNPTSDILKLPLEEEDVNVYMNIEISPDITERTVEFKWSIEGTVHMKNKP